MGLKLCFISDTHGKHYELKLPEDIDILIHCGDISSIGTRAQVVDFLYWFGEQKAKYRIFCAGNHDFWFEPGHPRNRSLRPGDNPRDIISGGIIYLEDETIEIEGIKIFASPWSPWFHSWAFNAMRGEEIKKHWDLIEPDTDIVITHGPPANTYLDRCQRGEQVGCADLARAIAEIKPKICAFGHIHEAYGVEDKEVLDLEDQEAPGKITKLINCSVLNLRYEMTNDPVVIDWDEMCELHDNKEEQSDGEQD
jgi:Icc-related predicted phosphoesterase